MPVHIPLPSLEALTDPAELSRLLERPVTTVTAVPVDDAQTSTEARFLRLTLDDGSAPGLFVKIVDPAQDWVAYVTADDRRRAVALWSEGLFERMPSEADAAVLACAEWEDGYAVLMPDLGAQLPVSGAVLAPAGFDALLEAMAAMHAAFWGDASLDDPHLGLCAPEAFLSHTSPGRAARHRKQHDSWIFGVIEEGWDALPTFMDAGLVAELRALNDDPAPILSCVPSRHAPGPSSTATSVPPTSRSDKATARTRWPSSIGAGRWQERRRWTSATSLAGRSSSVRTRSTRSSPTTRMRCSGGCPRASTQRGGSAFVTWASWAVC